MAARIMLDVENVFYWQRTDTSARPGAGHRAWIRECLDALVWWSDDHVVETGRNREKTSTIRGYGKYDNAGEAYVGVLRRWGNGARMKTDRIRVLNTAHERVDAAETAASRKTARRALADILQTDVVRLEPRDGPALTFTAVGTDLHAAETVLLAEVAAVLNAEPGPHRIVLCSRDNKLTRFYGAQREDNFLLAYHPAQSRQELNLLKDARHEGDPRVVAFNVLKEVHHHRDRLPDLVRGAELTSDVLAGLDIVGMPVVARPLREDAAPDATHAHLPAPDEVDAVGADEPGPEEPDDADPAGDLAPLLRVDWTAALSAQTWAQAWPGEELAIAVAEILTRELDQVAAVNTELGALILEFRAQNGAGTDATTAREQRLLLLQAIALLAIARSSASFGGPGWGARIRSDPRLRKFRVAYELIQPALGRVTASPR